MNIEDRHFATVAENFIAEFQSRMKGLDPRLEAIVLAELELGNLVTDVRENWPNERAIVVSFAKALSKSHKVQEGITFNAPNDPKSWVYEYTTYNSNKLEPIHMLISGGKNA